MNVLITGANGFVGKNLTQRLSTIKDRRDTIAKWKKVLSASCSLFTRT